MPKSGEHRVNTIDSFFRVRPSSKNLRDGESVSFLEDGKLIKQEKRNGVVYETKYAEQGKTETVSAGTTTTIIQGSSQSGDVTSVTAGNGLTGGGNSGPITLDVVGGTGITANANDIAIDSTVVTLTGTQTLTNKTLTAPTLTGTAQGANLTLTGDLTVGGTTTTLNAQNLQVKDKNIVLNYLDGDSSSTADGAGITIQDGVNSSTDATILWDQDPGEFDFSHRITAPSFIGNVTGSSSLNLLKSSNLSDLANASTARSNLGLGSLAELNTINGANWSGTDLAIANGGTGASTAEIARENLGLEIGIDIQPLDAGLLSIASLTTSANKMIYTTASDTYATTTLSATARTLLDDNTTADMLTTLGLTATATELNYTDGVTSNIQTQLNGKLGTSAKAADSELLDGINSTSFVQTSRSITPVSQRGISGGGDLSADRTIELSASQLNSVALTTSDQLILFDQSDSDIPKRFNAQDIFDTISGAVTIYSNTGNDRILTSGGGTTINGESNLTFDGDFKVAGTLSTLETVNFDQASGDTVVRISGTGNQRLEFKDSATGANSWIGIPSWDDDAVYIFGPTSTGNEQAWKYESSIHRFNTGSSEQLAIFSNGAIDMSGYSVADRHLEIGSNRQVNGYAYIDLIGDTTYTDFGARFIRENTGPNTGTAIEHRGTGVLSLNAKDAGSVRFYTSNTERVRIDSSGNMSLGNVAPGALLDVGGRIKLTSSGVLQWGASANAGNLTWDTGVAIVGSQSGIDLDLRAASGKNILFKVSSSEKMRLDSSGNVGIGANNPLRKLHVVGSMAVNEGTDQYYGILMGGGESNDPKITIGDWHNSSGSIMWDSSENVLKIDSQHSTANRDIVFTGNDFATEYMRVNATGLGVGITPAEVLDLKSASGDCRIRLDAPNGSDTEIKFFNAGAAVWTLGHDDGSGAFRLGTTNVDTNVAINIDSLGRVMIGDTSVHYTGVDLQVGSTSDGQNGIQIQTSTTGWGYVLFGDGTGADAYRGSINYKQGDDFLNFATAGGERMRIDSAGHVGINETNPSTELHLGTCPDARAITFDQSGRFNGIGNYFSSNASDSQLWFYCSDGGTNGDTNIRMKLFADGRLQLDNSDNVSVTLAKATRMGYSSSYKALILGDTSGTFTTCIGYDPSTNASASFTGDGREIIFRNGVEFTTPNSANNGFHNDILVLKDGNVGIGVASPSAKLEVNGGLEISPAEPTINLNRSNGSYSWKIVNGAGTGSYPLSTFNIANNAGTPVITALDSGNVGIGTTSPSSYELQFGNAGDKIGVDLSSGGTTRSAEIEFYNGSDGSMKLKTHNSSTGGIEFHTQGSKRMIVARNGNVGVGNLTSPAQPFQTHGTSADTRTRTSTSNHGTYFESGVTSDSAGILLVAGHASSILNIYLQGAGGTQNQFRFTHNGDFLADEDIVAYSTSVGSDRKLKDNIKDTSYGLSDVMKMRAVEFDWKEKRDKAHDIGVIAQEIEEIIPEVVKEVETLNTDGETHKVVDYAKLSSVLIKAIQEQQEQINKLKEKLNG